MSIEAEPTPQHSAARRTLRVALRRRVSRPFRRSAAASRFRVPGSLML